MTEHVYEVGAAWAFEALRAGKDVTTDGPCAIGIKIGPAGALQSKKAGIDILINERRLTGGFWVREAAPFEVGDWLYGGGDAPRQATCVRWDEREREWQWSFGVPPKVFFPCMGWRKCGPPATDGPPRPEGCELWARAETGTHLIRFDSPGEREVLYLASCDTRWCGWMWARQWHGEWIVEGSVSATRMRWSECDDGACWTVPNLRGMAEGEPPTHAIMRKE